MPNPSCDRRLFQLLPDTADLFPSIELSLFKPGCIYCYPILPATKRVSTLNTQQSVLEVPPVGCAGIGTTDTKVANTWET